MIPGSFRHCYLKLLGRQREGVVCIWGRTWPLFGARDDWLWHERKKVRRVPAALCAKADVPCGSLTRGPKLEPARESIFLLTLSHVDYSTNRWCGQRVFNRSCVQENREFSFEINQLPCLLQHRWTTSGLLVSSVRSYYSLLYLTCVLLTSFKD